MTSRMRQEVFNWLEREAMKTAGQEAGAYLDGIGKTDLAQLSEREWNQFCEHMIAGYRVALKRLVKNEVVAQ